MKPITAFCTIGVLVMSGFSGAVLATELGADSPPAPSHSPTDLPTMERAPRENDDDWLVGGFDRSSRWITGGLAAGLGLYWVVSDEDAIRDLGDVTQFVPLGFALGANLYTNDRQGLKQLGYASGTAFLATHGLKAFVDKSRPDDSADNSFPSGHTSASVTGAAYLWRRYGSKWGAPASILAAYTGLSRVKGQKHYLDDVISGAALGLISNWLWTDPIDERVNWSLFALEDGAALEVTYTRAEQSRVKLNRKPEGNLPGKFFQWEISRANVRVNDARSPNPGGELVDWRFDRDNNPIATASVAWGWVKTGSPHGFYLGLAPFEVREDHTPSESLDFAGQTFPAEEPLRSSYIAYDYRFGYGYSAIQTERFSLTLGAALAVYDTELELTGSEQEAHIAERAIRPTLGMRVHFSIARNWLVFANFAGWSDSEYEIRDLTAQLAYRIDDSWALSLGYRRVDREVNTSKIYNRHERDQLALGVWYFW